jgi:hypothetical protein
MVKVGDAVRFNAVSGDWGLIDWEMESGDQDYSDFIEWLDGGIAEVTDIVATGPNGEPLYVDLRFDDLHNLYAISIVHVEAMPGVLLFRRKAS